MFYLFSCYLSMELSSFILHHIGLVIVYDYGVMYVYYEVLVYYFLFISVVPCVQLNNK